MRALAFPQSTISPSALAALTALALSAGALALSPGAAAAQDTVIGTITDSASSEPLEGVFVQLLGPDGSRLTAGFTNGRGHVLLRPGGDGPYRLVAERIGYATDTTTAFGVRAGGPVRLAIALRREAVTLSELRVTAHGECHPRPARAAETYRLWRDIHQALEAAEWTRHARLLDLHLLAFVRAVDSNLRVQRTFQEDSVEAAGEQPFGSVSDSVLARYGYMQNEVGQPVFYGPDLRVLLSDGFLSDHCFRLTRGGAPHEGWVGLAFRPVRSRPVPEIEGTLWVEGHTERLRQLDFRYVQIPGGEALSGARGYEEFYRLPSGPWIVSRWYLLLPVVYRGNFSAGLPFRWYKQVGAQVLRIEGASGRTLVRFRTGKLGPLEVDTTAAVAIAPDTAVPPATASGPVAPTDTTPFELRARVEDAVSGGPVPGAVVELPALDLAAATGKEGIVTFRAVRPGSYRVTVRAPRYAPVSDTSSVRAGQGLLVRLEPHPVTLPEISVAVREGSTVRKLERRVTRTGYDAVSIGPKELATSGTSDLATLLEARTAVSFSICPSSSIAHTAGHAATASAASSSMMSYSPIENEREGLGEVPGCISGGGGSPAPTKLRVYFNDMLLPSPELIAGWSPRDFYLVQLLPGLGMLRVYTRDYVDRRANSGWSPPPICIVCLESTSPRIP